ncbi:hypothetical protein PG997_005039 [Apiospora hydei]|uniref:Uncharacterized protein n=1 Tax=Apiospora hydei TaxID=1337664 RepID=A0ABR1X3U9_9PEZI
MHTVVVGDAKRERITLEPAPWLFDCRQTRQALRLMDTDKSSLPQDEEVTYYVTTSWPPLRDGVILHQPSELDERPRADGFIGLSLKSTSLREPKRRGATMIISWGTTPRNKPFSRPWCKIWTLLDLQNLLSSLDFPDGAYVPRALRDLARAGPELRAQVVYDSFHELDGDLIPSANQNKPTETVLIEDHQAGSKLTHRLTVSIESITFLERTMLEMRIGIEKMKDDTGGQSQEQCVILE